MPRVSVVVPVHDVEDYLSECLDSLEQQTWGDLEVVLVDDSSTDGSGTIAEEYAGRHEHWQVVHVQAGSPGAARNAGIDVAGGDYLTFVDADDVVPVDGVERLVTLLEQTGSDLACGMAMRYDGLRTWPSPLQVVAIPATVLRTHITKTPSLLRDTTVWAKLYRRSWWDTSGLRFAEGVLFEDMPVATEAQFKATTVDLLDQPVYWWRVRQSDTQSITQRRTDIGAFEDRMRALNEIDGFLREAGEDRMKRLHDRKILRFDLPVHMNALPDGERDFQERFVELVGEFLRQVDPAVLKVLPVNQRLPYHLAGRGMVDELVEVMRVARLPKRNNQFIRRGLRMYADLPYFRDRRVGIPDSAYDVTRSQPLLVGVDDVRWSGNRLVVDGHGYIDRCAMGTPWTSAVRVFVRRADDESQTVRARLRRRRRRDLTARFRAEPINYDWAGFRAALPVEELVRASADGAEWEAVVQVATAGARRGGRLGRPRQQRGRHPEHRIVDGVVVAPRFHERQWLRVSAWRPVGVVESTALVGGDLVFRGRWSGAERPASLGLFRRDSLHGLPLRVEGDGARFTATIPLADVPLREDIVSETDWDLKVVEGEDSPGAPIAVEPGVPELRMQHGQRELSVARTELGAIYVRDQLAVPAVTEATWTPSALRLAGRCPEGFAFERLRLEHRSGGNLDLPVTVRDGRWSTEIPLRGRSGELSSLRWLPTGMWRAYAEPGGRTEGDRARLLVGSELIQQLVGRTDVDGVQVRLHVGRELEFTIGVDAGGPERDRGAYHQRRNRWLHYRTARRRPVQDVVLVEAWRGKQYADSPRAIAEELQRRHPELRVVWAFTSLTVERPEGVESVLRLGREYWELLGRARWIVGNDSLPTAYRKRPGQTYVQTWHGTPLKRLAFDVTDLKIANTNYLNEFKVEVEQWDYLVSPNAFSSEIMPRAFRYDGKVLDSGYPRNDVFYRTEEATERAAEARRRLDLPEGKKVALYAPTWRDDRYDSRGQYQFDMRLNLEQLRRQLGDEWVVLVRGHHILAGGVTVSPSLGDLVRNVTSYPDIQDLYLVSDVCITDYSSVMFDFANTGRPMLFYTWDLESYRDELRGFYFDLEADAPGPLLRTTTEVGDALLDLEAVAQKYAPTYERFRERFCGWEDGHAAERVVREVWGG